MQRNLRKVKERCESRKSNVPKIFHGRVGAGKPRAGRVRPRVRYVYERFRACTGSCGSSSFGTFSDALRATELLVCESFFSARKTRLAPRGSLCAPRRFE